MNAKVLVVDDDALIRTSLCLFLDRNGFESEVAQDAEKALELIGGAGYDVIVTDYQMPGMNGLELIRILRTLSPSSALIMMSGCTNEAVFRNSGADLCLRKPFSAEVFVESITRVLCDSPRSHYNKPSSTKLR